LLTTLRKTCNRQGKKRQECKRLYAETGVAE